MTTTVVTVESQEADEAKLALEDLHKDEGDKGEGDKGKAEGDKTEEEKAADVAAAELAEKLKPIEKTDGSMETADEAKARVDAEIAAAAEPTEAEKLAEENKDLRQMLRTVKRDQVQMKAKVDRLSMKPAKEEGKAEGDDDEGGDADEGGKKKVDEIPLSRVEELQGAITQIGQERGASLDILLETMAQGSYKDVREVCSRGNFDDMFEAIAQEASKDGKNYDETLLEVELNVWAKENPYSYMYDLIQKYHPAYKKEEGAAKPGEKEDKHVVADAPGNIADKGGDSDLKSGWTSKRIDDLPEAELDAVPKDVYDKYMLGELD